jgi:hypothetical protein
MITSIGNIDLQALFDLPQMNIKLPTKIRQTLVVSR